MVFTSRGTPISCMGSRAASRAVKSTLVVARVDMWNVFVPQDAVMTGRSRRTELCRNGMGRPIALCSIDCARLRELAAD